MQSDSGSSYGANVVFDESTGKISAARSDIRLFAIEALAKDGPDLLENVRDIGDKYLKSLGFFSYSDTYSGSEIYVIFYYDAFLSVGLSIAVVFIIVLLITGSLPASLLVIFNVALVNMFLLGFVYFWRLTMNNIVVANSVMAIGLSVDYSAHIAHSYLTAS